MGEDPLLQSFFQPADIPFGIDRGTVMEDPVKDCSDDHMITEDLIPFL
jgi:hypothetical protein